MIFSCIGFINTDLSARPGGGHSSSGSSSSSSSKNSSSYSSSSSRSSSSYSRPSSSRSSGSGVHINLGSRSGSSGSPVVLFVVIGIFVIGFVIIKITALKTAKEYRENNSNDSPENELLQEDREEIEQKLNEFKQADPGFSIVLFLDFASSVYTKYYALQGKPEFSNLRPFLLKHCFDKGLKDGDQKIHDIVIGSMRITDVRIKDGYHFLTVNYSANYTKTEGDNNTRYIVEENMIFKKDAELLSPEPEKLRELSCPNCGGPANFTDSGKCNNCGTEIKEGAMQWCVCHSWIQTQEEFKVEGLTHYAKERGTERETIIHPFLTENTEKFAVSHDLAFDKWLDNFKENVVNEFFMKIYSAWSNGNLLAVRNIISDRVFESWNFWMKNYAEKGLTNKIDNINIKRTQLVKIDLDKYYESVTIRIFAGCNDYVVNTSGKVVGGSDKKIRDFSEYWTFIRRTGVERDEYDYATCPNCGAPSDNMGQTGVCRYCDTKISNGDFSWVLTLITQDESYTG